MKKISMLFILAITLLCGCKDEPEIETKYVAKERPVTYVKYYYDKPADYETSDNSYRYSSNNHIDSYDKGYNDIYEEDDYDWDRYYEDDDYASGVDDAIEEHYEEYGEYWE